MVKRLSKSGSTVRDFRNEMIPPDNDGEFKLARANSPRASAIWQSPNFKAGVRGWRIDGEGNAEFQSIVVFGGDGYVVIDAGGLTIDAQIDALEDTNTIARKSIKLGDLC